VNAQLKPQESFLYVVPKDELTTWTNLVIDMAVRLQDFDSTEFSAEKIVAQVAGGHWQVLLYVVDGECKAAGLVHKHEIALGHSLFIIGAVGFDTLDKEECIEVLSRLESLAKYNGCIRLEWIGRAGWERWFRGLPGIRKRVSIVKDIETDEAKLTA
jgi:hypothetical protein